MTRTEASPADATMELPGQVEPGEATTPTERIEPASPMSPTPQRFGPSVPTVVWGLILGLVAAAAIVHQVSDVDVDFSVAGPLVLLGAGAILLLWGIAGLGRRRRRTR